MLVLSTLASVLIIVFVSKEPTLTLSVEPKDATVLIDGKKLNNLQLKTRVSKGEHEIQVSKEGYRPYLQGTLVNKNTTLSIILIPAEEQVAKDQPLTLNVPPYAADFAQPASPDSLIAIDKKNFFLIRITKSGITTLYAKPVYSYAFVNPYVALIEKGGLDKIAIINIENGLVKNFDVKTILPVISISLDPSIKTVFLLGKHDPATRTATLYSSPIDKIILEDRGSFNADTIQSLLNNKIVFSLSADAADLSKFSVFDLVNSKYLYQTKGSGILTSPYYENLVVYSSSGISVVSLESFVSKKYPFSFGNQKVFWKTQSVLGILTNTFPGVKISSIDTQSGSQISNIEVPQLNQISVRFVIGYLEHTLYFMDADGKIWSVTLP